MRKLTILMVVIALLTCAVVVTVPALCANGGANGNSCDLVTLLRGAARIANGERCKQTPRPTDCMMAEIAGMSK